jgi:anti-sigma regulatory factor (Ser/Thr protein kinase)
MGEDASIPAHRKQAVSVIKRGGEHLLSLIEGTLDMAQIESGKLTLNVKPMQFANGMYEIASLFELQAAAKGLAFRFEVQGAMPEWVRADEKRVRQIVINLLGNAIKFTQQGSVTFRLRYAREMAQVEVHDTGPGMLPNELDHIFDPFERAASVAVGAAGSGLGLTIAKMLTDLMGGELTATSQLGQGSVFRVRLFLPELHNQPGQLQERLALRKARHGYEGARRKIWWWTTKKPIRISSSACWNPGFILRTAASGHDGLDLLAADYDRMWCCWTWPCQALTAGRRCAACVPWKVASRWSPSCRPTRLNAVSTTSLALRRTTSSLNQFATPSYWTGWVANWN